MPKYKKKITELLEYEKFKTGIEALDGRGQPLFDDRQRAFLTLLFFAGCRVSEALALTADDIHCAGDTVFVQFFRLKGSKQTDPQELPRADALVWLCGREGGLFPFSRTTAYRLVKRAFPILYPHFFRMNRITKIDILFGDAAVYHMFGISATSIDHYRGKVDVKRVGEALRGELKR